MFFYTTILILTSLNRGSDVSHFIPLIVWYMTN